MKRRRHYSDVVIPKAEAQRMRREFLKKAGPSMELLFQLMDALPMVGFTVKNEDGRIMHLNRGNLDYCGWQDLDDVLGYHPNELYPPDQAAVYVERDKHVFETGEPIEHRVYGFVADRSTNLNDVTIYPVYGLDGKRIGAATVYFRAEKTHRAANWYDPIRRAIVYLNEHYSENVTVEKLANIAHYSVAQFRKRFVELTQMSPSRYIAQVRVNVARNLLSTTDRRIVDIATDVGFFDHSHFIRTFRSLTGQTPDRYRRERLYGVRPLKSKPRKYGKQ